MHGWLGLPISRLEQERRPGSSRPNPAESILQVEQSELREPNAMYSTRALYTVQSGMSDECAEASSLPSHSFSLSFRRFLVLVLFSSRIDSD